MDRRAWQAIGYGVARVGHDLMTKPPPPLWSKDCVCVCARTRVQAQSFRPVWLFATPWTVGHQAPLSMGFSRQEYWSGLPFSSPGDLPDPGIEPRSPTLEADALTSEPPGKPLCWVNKLLNNPMD